MKTILALAAAASATVLAASLANAQECVNGYRELGNQVIVLCDEGFAPEAAVPEGGFPEAGVPETEASAYPAEPLPQEEPLITGSISTGEEAVQPGIAAPPPEVTASMEVDGPWACEPGKYWMLYSEGSERPMMC
jgi:hypothetical protein